MGLSLLPVIADQITIGGPGGLSVASPPPIKIVVRAFHCYSWPSFARWKGFH